MAKHRCKDISDSSSSPQSPHRAFAPAASSGLVSPPAANRAPTESLPRQSLFSPQQHTERFVISNVIYKSGEKKRKFVILFFTQLHLVSKKMRFSKIAKLVNAPAIHDQHIVVKLFQILPAAHRAQTESLCTNSLLRACFSPSCPQTLQ